MYGDGSTGRDYTYVQDITNGILNALNYIESNEKVYEIINLGNNTPVLLNEMINIIYSAMNKDKKIKQMPMQPGDVLQTYADISKAQKLLNYKPVVSFKQGILNTIEWIREQ